jgi:multicomponent Na+:H+ antiporter subunit G
MMLFGASFMLLAAVGIVRLPDLFIRMHAATKSGTLGVSGMLLAVALHFGDLGIAMRSALIIVFIFMTAPVAAHFIGRAAYIVGVPQWERTVTDELHGKYDQETGELASAPEVEHRGDESQVS